jgi:predicted nucleic acid-binding protein
MKGLDTPVLLRLLRGDPAARLAIRKLQGEEIATTEWNMLELEVLSQMDPSSGREQRRSALEKLRRRLTILPIDERTVETAAKQRRRAPSSTPLGVLAILCALESRGCTDLITDAATARTAPSSKVRIQVLK